MPVNTSGKEFADRGHEGVKGRGRPGDFGPHPGEGPTQLGPTP